MKTVVATLLWLMVAVVIVAILRQDTSTTATSTLVFAVMPTVLVLTLAALLIPSYGPNNSTTRRGPVWYAPPQHPTGPAAVVPVPSSWQGWLIDFASIMLISLNGYLVYQHFTHAINGNLNVHAVLIDLIPSLIVVILNLWVKHRFADLSEGMSE